MKAIQLLASPISEWPMIGHFLSHKTKPLLALMFWVIFSSLALGQRPLLEVMLTLDSASYRDGSPIMATYSMRNNTAKPVHVLKWGTPLGGNRERFLDITLGNEEVRYIGPYFKRSHPEASDYLTINPGDVVTVIFDLRSLWTIERSGSYTVALNNRLHDVVFDDGKHPRKLRNFKPFLLQPVTIQFEFVDISGLNKQPAPPAAPLVLTYVACSSSQQTSLANVVAALVAGMPSIKNTLNTGAQNSTNWGNCTNCPVLFGSTFNATNATTATNIFNGAVSSITAQKITFYCDGNIPGCSTCPSSNTFAFTCGYPNIGLCNKFWSASDFDDADSKAGTLFHEVCHWQGAKDIQYGCSNCTSLASSNPASAVQNADSHEYFLEYTHSNAKACGIEGRYLISMSIISLLLLLQLPELRKSVRFYAP